MKEREYEWTNCLVLDKGFEIIQTWGGGAVGDFVGGEDVLIMSAIFIKDFRERKSFGI